MHRLPKDSDAELDYGFDWSDWLNDDDTITSSNWQAISPATSPPLEYVVGSSDFTDQETKVWLKGGKPGQTYTVTNSIETADGRKDDRSLIIEVEER